jgi:hypothetical protein
MEGDTITRECVSQSGTGGTCGRPFLVSGSVRLAAGLRRDDWCRSIDEQTVGLEELTRSERGALAAHWEQAALMEHASIAAFARFTLELLALGAPAQLVEQASAAMSDEQRHATTCFTLASRFAGRQIGAGPLPIDGCLANVELTEVTVTAFLEGCIGETLAAVEARELAQAVEDPVLRRTLAGIADDEARHALLAWSFLRWALGQGGPALAARIRGTLRAAIARPIEPSRSGFMVTPERELALGLPSAALRAGVRRRVLEEIVTPCLDAISASLDRPPPSRPIPTSRSSA